MPKKNIANNKIKVVYAKNCVHSDKNKEVYELILFCNIKNIGCHSQVNCEHYKEIKKK